MNNQPVYYRDAPALAALFSAAVIAVVGLVLWTQQPWGLRVLETFLPR